MLGPQPEYGVVSVYLPRPSSAGLHDGWIRVKTFKQHRIVRVDFAPERRPRQATIAIECAGNEGWPASSMASGPTAALPTMRATRPAFDPAACRHNLRRPS